MTAVMLGNSWVCTVVSMALIIWIMGVLYSCYSDDMGEFMKLKSLLPSLLKRLQINYFVLSVMLLLLQLDSLALFPWWQASPAVILWDFPAIGIPEQSWFNILAVISKLCEPSIHHAIVGSSVHISFSTIYVKGHLYCHIFCENYWIWCSKRNSVNCRTMQYGKACIVGFRIFANDKILVNAQSGIRPVYNKNDCLCFSDARKKRWWVIRKPIVQKWYYSMCVNINLINSLIYQKWWWG